MSDEIQECDDAHHEMLNGPRVRQSLAASSCSRLVDSIAKTRPYVEHTAAVEAELSRKLERERDEARRLATEYRDAYSKHFKDGYSGIASLPWENTKADQP
jgi:hypothetical protein